MNTIIEKITDDLRAKYAKEILDVTEYAGDVIVLVDKSRIIDILTHLRDEHHFIYLADMVATDRFTETDRFEVIYNIICLRNSTRLFIKTRVTEENPVLPTATTVWEAANWNEREAYDMFGIRFEGHPDPRRIFMPEDFEYFPLRKEFPLLGVPGSLELPSTNPDAE